MNQNLNQNGNSPAFRKPLTIVTVGLDLMVGTVVMMIVIGILLSKQNYVLAVVIALIQSIVFGLLLVLYVAHHRRKIATKEQS